MIDKRLAAKTAKADKLAAHVRELAAGVGVTVEERTTSARAFAFPSERRILVPPVRGVRSYFTALHEVGHIVGAGRSAPVLEREANAWAYALDVACVDPTPGVHAMVRRCLRSYLKRHIRMSVRRHVRWPDADHVFWKLAAVEATFSAQGVGWTNPRLHWL